MNSLKRQIDLNSRDAGQAFTLRELLIVIAVLALMASAMWSGLAKSGPEGQEVVCLNGKRQLCLAWLMYADDNSSKLAPNSTGAQASGGAGDPVYGIGYVEGWLDWSTASDNTNVALISTARYSRLASYLKGATTLFKCPADRYLSNTQKARGWPQRVRSVSLSACMGESNAEAGPWSPIYRHLRKLSEFRFPSPAESLTFIDEHPDSINDPMIYTPQINTWIDVPAAYHEGAAGVACADGHVEMHRWTGSLLRSALVRYTFVPPPAPVKDPDIHWFSFHSPRVSTNSY